MIYLQLFWAYIQIGLFSIGGGHASIPVAQSMVVDKLGWLTMDEFSAMITLSEMTPGPFSINSATYVGTKMAGTLGGLAALLGFLVPSVVVCSTFYFIYKRFRKMKAIDGLMRGIRPAVAGLIGSAAVSISLLAFFGASTLTAFQTDFALNPVALGIAAVAFVLSRKTKINPVIIILICGVLGVAVYSFV